MMSELEKRSGKEKSQLQSEMVALNKKVHYLLPVFKIKVKRAKNFNFVVCCCLVSTLESVLLN